MPARPCHGIVVTYGSIPSGNGLLFRSKVRDRLLKDGCDHLPYQLLSISEFDSFLRLVELGNAPDAIMLTLSDGNGGSFPGAFQATLQDDAIIGATRRRGELFLASLPGESDAAPTGSNE
ncbi:MAG: hypothetical protein JSR52_15065 [Planctomycetes bacterium]|nr:hypothetical protein [Planctomycetota bacterium]